MVIRFFFQAKVEKDLNSERLSQSHRCSSALQQLLHYHHVPTSTFDVLLELRSSQLELTSSPLGRPRDIFTCEIRISLGTPCTGEKVTAVRSSSFHLTLRGIDIQVL